MTDGDFENVYIIYMLVGVMIMFVTFGCSGRWMDITAATIKLFPRLSAAATLFWFSPISRETLHARDYLAHKRWCDCPSQFQKPWYQQSVCHFVNNISNGYYFSCKCYFAILLQSEKPARGKHVLEQMSENRGMWRIIKLHVHHVRILQLVGL